MNEGKNEETKKKNRDLLVWRNYVKRGIMAVSSIFIRSRFANLKVITQIEYYTIGR